MKGIVAWFASNAVAANLLMVVAFVGGIMGYSQMEQKFFPVAPVNGVSISVAWNGASPQDVEEQIVTRIEEVVANLDGIKRITSVAREGRGSVNIAGKNDIDMEKFLTDVKQRVDQINNLPQAAFQPQVTRWEQRNRYMGIAIHGDVDQRTLKRVTDKIRDDIAKIPGGELAEAQAIIPEEVSIEISEDALRRYGLSFNEVAAAIRTSSLNSSGGQIRSDAGDVAITARQLADTAEQFGNIIVRQTSEQGTIRVDDVATVIDGFVDANVEARFDRELSAFVMIPSPDKMQIIDYADGIKDYVERANDPSNGIVPEAIKLDVIFDDSIAFQDRMNLIFSSAMTGALLVMLVLILFLRPIVAFWVTAGIITAFAGGIMLLPYMGVSWNVLSTFAVLLVIGVVVDDAIVVGENIHKEVESGRREGVDAAIFGTQMVIKPVIFGVLTTIIAFIPWAYLSGPERNFTQQISFVVVAALIFSIIECMLILPAHLAHMKKQAYEGASGGLMRIQRRIADSLIWFANNIYKPTLEFALRFRYATIVFFFSLFFLATRLSGFGIVPFAFMPEIESDLVIVNIELPDGTPYSRTIQVRDQLEYGIQQLTANTEDLHPEFEGRKGEDGKPIDIVDGSSVIANDRRIQAYVGILEPQFRPTDLSTKQIAETLREYVGPIQDAEDISFDFTFNDDDSSVRFALNHPDLETLRAAAEDVKAHLATYENLYDVGDNLSSAAEEIRVTLKPGAETLGINLSDVTGQLRAAYFGIEVQRLPRDGDDVRVMVRLPKSARQSLDSLDNLRVRTNDGREIPITQIADFEYAPGINRIIRRERTRSVSVFAEVKGEGGRGRVIGEMEQTFWPGFTQRWPEVTRGAAGGFQEEQEFFAEINAKLLFAFGFMYILLAVAFRSYWQPILLMTALPFAYCGALFGHWAFGVNLALFSFFGMAAAAGVVINDNLVLLDYVNRKRDEGVGAVQALVDAGVSRFRPILLTSVTTFVGILPLLAERSVQAQFLKPMLVSLGCAVAFALFVSLFLVPAMYAVGVEIGRIFRWSWGGRPYRTIGEGYSGEVSIDEEELIGTSHMPAE